MRRMQGSDGDKDNDEGPENMEKKSRILPGGETEDLVGRSDLSRAWPGSGELPMEQGAQPGTREHMSR